MAGEQMYQSFYPNYQMPDLNAMLNQRLAQYQQQYPQLVSAVMGQQIQPPQQQRQAPVPRSMLVTSIDEAKATNVLDGAKYIFYNASNNEIYVRQFNFETGTAPLEVYRKTEPGPPEQLQMEPEPVDEVQVLRKEMRALQDKYDALEAMVNGLHANGKSDGAAEPAGTADGTADSGNGATGNATRPNSKSAGTSKSTK